VQVQADLQRLGVQSTSGGNGVAATTTQVRYRVGSETAAKGVQAYLTGEAQLVPDRTVKSGEVQVLLGNSFTGIVDPKAPATTATTAAPTPPATPATLPPKGSDPSVNCPS